jgi:hypothetical protein
LKLNNQFGFISIEVIILTAITLLLFGFIFTTFMPFTQQGIETKTTAIVLGTETAITTTPSRGTDTKHYHCDVFVKSDKSKTQMKFRFDVDSPTEAKIYCDALVQDNTYSFTHYEYPENATLISVFDYELIENVSTN